MECYERASEVLLMLLNIEVSDSTIYRITDEVGQKVTAIIDHPDKRNKIEVRKDENMYVQCDGSMLLTREEGWKEVKLGRTFKSSSILPESTNRQWIRESEYVAHLGNHEHFENLMSQIIDDPYKTISNQIVFIGDGAKWIWSWVEAEYPKATQILDYYHAMEHIGGYITSIKKKKEEADKLIKKIGGILKRRGIETVLKYIENIPRVTKVQKDKYDTLIKYLNNNKTKMNYPQYISKGLLIGSGAIESAHRTVLQKRMKQSGQRWSKRGLRNMIKLRSANMSGYWNEVTNIIRQSA